MKAKQGQLEYYKGEQKMAAKKKTLTKAKSVKKSSAQPSLMQRAESGFDSFRRKVSPIYNLTNPKKKA